MSANNDMVMGSDSFNHLFQEASDSYDECYNLRTLEWIQRSNSCIREDTRELDKEPFTK